MAQDDVSTDRARSWIVAACCCFCNLTFYGVSRLSGIMLVAATQTFQVSRANAAVPFSLSTAIRNLAGVFVGHLGHRFGVGPVVATGCIIASLGSGLCFFAQNTQWLAVCWGGVFGFGFGLTTCLLPLAINQNFVKHNGTASGISYSGSYLGSFIFPPIVVWLLNSYGLQGTFLIISGSVLNVLVAAIFLREPATKRKYTIKNSSGDIAIIDSYEPNKGENTIWANEENGNLWKQNLNRAFLDSQYSLSSESGKLAVKPNACSGNASYLHQEYRQRLPEHENTQDFDNTACSEISKCRPSLLPNLLTNFKFENALSEGELRNGNDGQNRTRIAPFRVAPADRNAVDASRCSNVLRNGCTRTIAKQDPTASKICFRKLFENRLLSRGKYKAKCKLKLQKLKKVIIESLLKVKVPGEGQNDNVKLTSFRYLHSFLGPNSYDVAIPNRPFNVTLPHLRLCAIAENRESSDFTNTSNGLQRHLENVYTVKPSKVKAKTNTLPILDGLLVYDKTPVLLSFKNHVQNTIINNCDAPVDVKKSTYVFLPNNKDNSRQSSFCDSSSSSCKDIQSFAPSFSSELTLQSRLANRKFSTVSLSKSSGKVARTCFGDWFHMLREPMFTIIGFTMSIQTFIVVCVVTTIEDYAKDVGIPEDRTHWALMALSISNLTGTLTLGSITDRGFISRHRFLALCFFGMSLSLVAVSLVAVSLPSLLAVIAVYGLLESGVIITFPILTKEFVKGERRQAVAIASSNVLSAPTVMLVPMLIGHFRDNIGCYSGLFHLLGATSLTCSVLWLLAPAICHRRSSKNKNVLKMMAES